MNVDRILETMNRLQVDYLLIGGVNFLLRHTPVLTYDMDVWIADSPDNLRRCERALAAMNAEWGESVETWATVGGRTPGWLARQAVFCLTSPLGAIDVFLSVKGLEDWAACRDRAVRSQTAAGVEYLGLSDGDMLRCQLALPEGERKEDGSSLSEKPAPMNDHFQHEHQKREAAWDPLKRWLAIQETITWAEGQATVQRNTKQKCLELERRKLGKPLDGGTTTT